jgi:hypothetical protein
VVVSALLAGTTHSAHAAGIVGKLKNYNGLCADVPDADYGWSLLQADCAHAHNLVFDTDSSGHAIIWVQGHPGHCVAAGDAWLTVLPCTDGRSWLTVDSEVTNPNDGLSYQRYRFTVGGVAYYAHGNGNGMNITMIDNPGGSRAAYWLGIF